MAFPALPYRSSSSVDEGARQKKPSIKFSPRLDADKDTAEILRGWRGTSQYSSDAQVAYETAINIAPAHRSAITAS